mmetsp:Transcript_28486/g.71474  ORF Transcript_28486/g.71474 Transcript_28486/m.71474 type:complete len:214 (+) Transcript_28486:708-1349(+)
MFSNITASSPPSRNDRSACPGVSTIGSPPTLKLVLSSTGNPESSANRVSSVCIRGWDLNDSVCSRAVPSTCTTAGITARLAATTGATNDMKGDGPRESASPRFGAAAPSSGPSAPGAPSPATPTARPNSKYSAARSLTTTGASGRNISRFLISALIRSTTAALRGLARIDRLPSARGPNSDRPQNHPMTRPSLRSCAATSSVSSPLRSSTTCT